MLKTPRKLATLLLLAGCVGVTRDEDLNNRLRERLSTQCAGAPHIAAQGTSEIPLEERFGLPAVSVRIQDRTLFFLIDTGSEFCLLRPGLVEELDLPVSGRTRLSLLGESGETLTTCVHDMTVGTIRCRHLPFVVSPGHLERHFLGLTIETLDGVLGMPFLGSFATTIDTAQGLVRLTPPREYQVPTGEGVCVTRLKILADGRPCVNVTLHDGKKHPFLLDTGARRCVVRHELARRTGLAGMGEANLASLGVEVRAYLTELPRVIFESTPTPLTLEDHPAYVLPRSHSGMLRHVDGLIGFELLQDYVVTIEPKSKQLILEKRE